MINLTAYAIIGFAISTFLIIKFIYLSKRLLDHGNKRNSYWIVSCMR